MFFTKEQRERLAQLQAEFEENQQNDEKVVWEHTPRRIRYEIQAQYATGWQRFDPEHQPRYRYEDKAIARAAHLADLIPHRPLRVVEVEL